MKEVKHRSRSMKHILESDFEFFHYRDSSARQFDYKHHEVYEIYLLLSGRVDYLIEGRTYRLKPGDILLINDNELHKPVIQAGITYERIIIWVKHDYLEKHSSENSRLATCFEITSGLKNNLLRPTPEQGEYIRKIFSRLEEALSTEEFGRRQLANAYLMELIVLLNRIYLKESKGLEAYHFEYNEKINKIIQYIEDHLEEELPVVKLASAFYTSKYHLLHEFKRHTGYSIHQYILNKRLIMAKNLLKEGRQVMDVYSACGFGDYSNFIRAFKQKFGVTPGKYYKSLS